MVQDCSMQGLYSSQVQSQVRIEVCLDAVQHIVKPSWYPGGLNTYLNSLWKKLRGKVLFNTKMNYSSFQPVFSGIWLQQLPTPWWKNHTAFNTKKSLLGVLKEELLSSWYIGRESIRAPAEKHLRAACFASPLLKLRCLNCRAWAPQSN